MTVAQANSAIEVFSTLGDGIFGMTSFTWQERLGQPFVGDIELFSEESTIDLQSLLKQPMSIRIDGKADESLWLHGYISRFESTGINGKYSTYRARVISSLGLLAHSGGCRIFQEATTPEIIQQILGDHGFSGNLESKLSQTYAKRPYCVQYAESDFHFLQRLMEEEGIYYFFEHTHDKHQLVLADDLSAHQVLDGYASVNYRNRIHRGTDEYLAEYSAVKEFGIGAFVLNDYDFEKPRSPLLVRQNCPDRDPQFEWFQFPGDYRKVDEGQRLARIQMEAQNAARDTVRFHGNARGLRSGRLMTLKEHPIESINIQYLLTEATLQGQTSSMQVGDEREFSCQVSIACQSTKSPYRHPLETPRPVMRGPHIATVCGKAGEEIWTDPYGRIKVQFPWDRQGKNNEFSSCWIRVAQSSTGKNWGAMSLPRIGDEVIVEFLDGNPDRPIVTGRVYNADRMPPEELATAQAKTVFRTRSMKGADATAFHELTFDDTKDKESILFHSERDFLRVVENDDTLKIGFEKKSPGNRTVEIYNDEKIAVGLGSGSGSYALEAAKSIRLQCGNSSIEITPNGIQLTAPSITLKADGAIKSQAATVEVKADGAIKSQGATIEVKADASLKLVGGADCSVEGGASVVVKGAIVKIN